MCSVWYGTSSRDSPPCPSLTQIQKIICTQVKKCDAPHSLQLTYPSRVIFKALGRAPAIHQKNRFRFSYRPSHLSCLYPALWRNLGSCDRKMLDPEELFASRKPLKLSLLPVFLSTLAQYFKLMISSYGSQDLTA